MEGSAGGGVRFFQGIVGREVGKLFHLTGAEQSFFDVIALEINVGINFVGETIVALIALEADIVGGGADPNGFPIALK